MTAPHHPGSVLAPPSAERRRLLTRAGDIADEHLERLPTLRVAPVTDALELASRLDSFDFQRPRAVEDVMSECASLLTTWNVHTAHPRYFGLFNPPSAFPGILADTLAAAFNPQLAVWSHAPAAVEIEQRVVRFFGDQAGFAAGDVVGSLATGGTEANLTGVMLALTASYPAVIDAGLRALAGRPLVYASDESHHGLLKIVHQCGLGRDALRRVPVREDLTMDVASLEAMIASDRAGGDLPFLVVATAGTTSAGAIDPIPGIADVCAREGLRLHVDAAWAGAVLLSDALRGLLAGVERADSLTIDAHKWLAAPMGAGLFVCTDRDGLERAFAVSAAYMPGSPTGVPDPYSISPQWSRRFAGLKLFFLLACLGRDGYAAMVERQVLVGDYLRDAALADGWDVVNATPLPIVCLADYQLDRLPRERRDEAYRRVVDHVVESGEAWISTTQLASRTVVRACITSFETRPSDVDVLVACLARARRHVLRGSP